jgi:hypothetical protein
MRFAKGRWHPYSKICASRHKRRAGRNARRHTH